ncbi:hypothetical protein RS84_01344 [Microbacterium hydrocarbonoxydans]|uniref:DUF58 domain-containing protein n=1 Tax=Microbacterium hydrocarbonoxydans TaxID=273678 RepID=A0A0M2HVV4_9MICO|nr:DUF58 domain-containing protein [Microbacterium hydrocarbonoxydans]KJL48583.1 hypothetical protein RS84_01344 [Microbacterium hydrocarbonoxydans]
MSYSTESRITRTAAGTSTSTRTSTVTRYDRTRRGPVRGAVFGTRRMLRRTGRMLRRVYTWIGETVTAAGVLVSAALVLGLVGGLLFGWVEAWAVAAIALVLLVACVPFILGEHDYRIELALGRDRVVAGTDIGAVLDVRNNGARLALPGVVDVPVGEGLVEAHVPLLRPAGHHREELTIAAHRRGIIDVGPMTITRGDPIGILRRELSWPEVQRIHVHPVTVRIPSTSAGLIRDLEGTPSSVLVDADLSFHAVREYVVGDSQRHVHWKSTAKTGKLMVRQYEESRHARIAIILDLAASSYESDDEFETTVSAAASLALQGVTEGRDVLFVVSNEIPEHARAEVLSISTLPTVTPKALLDATSGVDAADNVMRLESVTKLTVQSYPDLSIAFLMTGSLMPLDRLRMAAISLPAAVEAVAVRSELGEEPTLRSARELAVMTLGALGDLPQMLARGVLK